MNDYTEVYGETLADLLHPGFDCCVCGDTGSVRIPDPYGDYLIDCDQCDAAEENEADTLSGRVER